MHDAALTLMDAWLRPATGQRLTALDVGSYDYNGSFRGLIERRGWTYTGLDIQPGPNVDVVAPAPYQYPFESDMFDVVLCGNMLHNVEHPWLLLPELARVLKPRGQLVVVTIWRWGVNAYPTDYWRFLPDGLRVLFEETGCLTEVRTDMDNEGNVIGIAVKR